MFDYTCQKKDKALINILNPCFSPYTLAAEWNCLYKLTTLQAYITMMTHQDQDQRVDKKIIADRRMFTEIKAPSRLNMPFLFVAFRYKVSSLFFFPSNCVSRFSLCTSGSHCASFIRDIASVTSAILKS